MVFSDSSIMSYVDGVPQLSKTSFQSNFSMRSGVVYLVGEYLRSRSSDGLSSFFVGLSEKVFYRVFVFCRVFPIDHLLNISDLQ